MRDTCSKFVEALFESDSFKESCSMVAVIYDRDVKSRWNKSHLYTLISLMIIILSLLINLRTITINVCIKLVLCSSHRHCMIYSIDNVHAQLIKRNFR